MRGFRSRLVITSQLFSLLLEAGREDGEGRLLVLRVQRDQLLSLRLQGLVQATDRQFLLVGLLGDQRGQLLLQQGDLIVAVLELFLKHRHLLHMCGCEGGIDRRVVLGFVIGWVTRVRC